MTQHSHGAYVDGCFRCDLSRAELPCDDCGHQVRQHSSEGGVGCLSRVYESPQLAYVCPCMRAGSSRADQ